MKKLFSSFLLVLISSAHLFLLSSHVKNGFSWKNWIVPVATGLAYQTLTSRELSLTQKIGGVALWGGGALFLNDEPPHKACFKACITAATAHLMKQEGVNPLIKLGALGCGAANLLLNEKSIAVNKYLKKNTIKTLATFGLVGLGLYSLRSIGLPVDKKSGFAAAFLLGSAFLTLKKNNIASDLYTFLNSSCSFQHSISVDGNSKVTLSSWDLFGLGNTTYTSKQATHIKQGDNDISGIGSKVDGSSNEVSGTGSRVDGSYNKVSGIGSRVIGSYNKVSGIGSRVSCSYSVVSGNECIVNVPYSKVSGYACSVVYKDEDMAKKCQRGKKGVRPAGKNYKIAKSNRKVECDCKVGLIEISGDNVSLIVTCVCASQENGKEIISCSSSNSIILKNQSPETNNTQEKGFQPSAPPMEELPTPRYPSLSVTGESNQGGSSSSGFPPLNELPEAKSGNHSPLYPFIEELKQQ